MLFSTRAFLSTVRFTHFLAVDVGIDKGLSPGCLAGLQAAWFDRTELESHVRSARPRIETSHVDQQDMERKVSSLHEKR